MSLQRASILVSLSSLFVYLISFINQLLIARTFGAGLRMDAYLAGSNVPLIVNNLVGAVFVYAVVPHIVHESVGRESIKPALTGLLAGCFGLSIITLAIGLLGHVLPLSHGTRFGDYQTEAAWAAGLSWGSCALFFLTAFSDAIFNANKRFLFPVLAYLPAYLLTSIACFFLGGKYGGPALAGATLVGYLLVVPIRIFQQKGVVGREVDFSMFRAFLKRIPFTALAVMSLYAFPLVDTFLGPRTGEGTLSILGYSTRIISTLAVIVALGPFGVLIPELATHSAEANRERFANRAATLLRYAITLLVPVALWIAVFRHPIIVLLLQRGAFGPDASQNLSDLLLYNVPGSIFMVLSMLLVRIFLADKRVVESAVLSTANLGMYLAACLVLTPRFGLIGFGYAFVLSWTLHAIAAIYVLFVRDKHHLDGHAILLFFGRFFVVTGITFLIEFGFKNMFPMGSTMTTLAGLVLSFVVCIGCYFGIGQLLGSKEHQRVWGMLSRLFARFSRSA